MIPSTQAPYLPAELERLQRIIIEARRVLESLLIDPHTGQCKQSSVPSDRVLAVIKILDTDGIPDMAPVLFSTDRAVRNAQIRALVTAPPAVREATLRASSEAAAKIYADNPELTEFTEAVMDDDFCGCDDEDGTKQAGENGE